MYTTARYSYDSCNRLIVEEHIHTEITFDGDGNEPKKRRKKKIKTTKTYSYDVGGNILSKKVFEGNEDNPVKEYMYGYDHESGFHDRLRKLMISDRNEEKDDNEKVTNYNYSNTTKDFYVDGYGRFTSYAGKQISFDALGRMTSFNGKTFTYNLDGVRLTKYDGEKTTKFFVDGKRILRSVDNLTQIWYYYDARGVVGISVSGKGAGEYLFHRNALGDVTHIYKRNTDTSYELVAKYEYDAWGNHKVYNADGTKNTSPDFIGNINPIRYRGYYYDVETGLYYLNARYYDPELCRFISADETQYLDPQSVNGLNLFAYCGNNPVMNIDDSGNGWWSRFWKSVGGAIAKIVVGVVVIAALTVASVVTGGLASVVLAGAAIGAGIGGLVGGTTNAIVAAKKGEDIFQAFAGGFFSGTITGAISGAVAASPIGLIGQVAINSLLSTEQYLIEQAISGESIDPMDLFVSFASGVIGGLAGGRGVTNVSKALGSKIAVKQIIQGAFGKSMRYIAVPIVKSFLGAVVNFIWRLIKKENG